LSKQERNFVREITKGSFGPGPGAYDPLTSLRKVVSKRNPTFIYIEKYSPERKRTSKPVDNKNAAIEANA